MKTSFRNLLWAREMGQWVRALAILPEGHRLIPITHRVAELLQGSEPCANIVHDYMGKRAQASRVQQKEPKVGK